MNIGMQNRTQLSIATLVLAALVTTCLSAAEPKAIEGIGPVGSIQKVHGNFQFTEGPAADRKGNIYFTDVAGNKIYRHTSNGKLEVFLDPSGHCNGLMFNDSGMLFACQMDGKILKIDPESKKVTPLTAEHNGNRYNAPNDLVLDRNGGVYFTDPRFRAPMPFPQGKEAVYYTTAKGEVTRLIDDLPGPNGVILSPDEKTLYVIPTFQAEMMAYPVEGPGKLGKGKVFCTLQQPEGAEGTGGDGLTIDTQGNLYITSRLGLQVFNPEGKLLGIIEFPEQPSNATFGGKDNKTLFVTARTSLYSCEMKVPGHVFSGE